MSKTIIVIAEGRRMIGVVQEYPEKANYLLKGMCFVSNELVKSEKGPAMRMNMSFPDGDYHMPMRYPWRPAKKDEVDLYEEIQIAYREATTGLALPRGKSIVGPDGAELPPPPGV